MTSEDLFGKTKKQKQTVRCTLAKSRSYEKVNGQLLQCTLQPGNHRAGHLDGHLTP